MTSVPRGPAGTRVEHGTVGCLGVPVVYPGLGAGYEAQPDQPVPRVVLDDVVPEPGQRLRGTGDRGPDDRVERLRGERHRHPERQRDPQPPRIPAGGRGERDRVGPVAVVGMVAGDRVE